MTDRRPNETAEQYAARLDRMARFAEWQAASYPDDTSDAEHREICAAEDRKIARAYRRWEASDDCPMMLKRQAV